MAGKNGGMKAKPILFSGPMVRAILSGEKTMTRRVQHPPPPRDATNIFYWTPPATIPAEMCTDSGVYYWCPDGIVFHGPSKYGDPGDRLWCRETWLNARVPAIKHERGCAASMVSATGCGACGAKWNTTQYHYRADGAYILSTGQRWRPSIFMPRDACRIELEITSISIERLQDITDEDIRREGIAGRTFADLLEIGATRRRLVDAFGPMATSWHGSIADLIRAADANANPLRKVWARGWDALNGKRPGCAWADNPAVQVIEFRRATT